MSDVPNWPPVSEVPLHGDLPSPESWWACTFPERPYDSSLTHWDWRCRGCFRHGEATLAQGDTMMTVGNYGSGWEDDPEPLGWSVARARAWHGVPTR